MDIEMWDKWPKYIQVLMSPSVPNNHQLSVSNHYSIIITYKLFDRSVICAIIFLVINVADSYIEHIFKLHAQIRATVLTCY